MIRSFIDQIGNTINISFPPKRIVSLVPSQSELLYDLGLDEEVVGITKFCIHPQKWFKMKQRVGGTKTVNIDVVKSVQPDLIIANKEENVKGQIEKLQTIAPVWVSDVKNLEEAISMISSIGTLVGKSEKALEITYKIESAFKSLPAINKRLKTAYLIWKDPYMAAGGDTFINNIIARAGLENIFSHSRRYPEISIDDLQQNDCQLLLLSSEPYPFKQKHAHALQEQLPDTKILLVDGQLFSWYGSRLAETPQYLRKLIAEACA
jgi:ABC-type Fe3+-hydroxamate transport system substrate-binding protein